MRPADQNPQQDIQSVLLQDGDVSVRVLSLGCVVQSWHVAGVPVVLGYDNHDDYRSNPFAMGMVIGRVANRISDASFDLDGEHYDLPANAAPHHIHGGPGGLGWRHWHTEVLDEKSVRFTFQSDHLDQGYPGNVVFEVLMRLSGYSLSYEISAVPDRDTPINMAQHHYFNLAGEGDIREHALRVAASRYTPTDAIALPTGSIEPVEKSIFDFRKSRLIQDADPDGIGHDASFVLDEIDAALPVAEVSAPNGMRLRLWSDQPCLQLYTASGLQPFGTPAKGPKHQRFAALCLEAQNYPDALANANFASIIHGPDNPYSQSLRIDISPP